MLVDLERTLMIAAAELSQGRSDIGRQYFYTHFEVGNRKKKRVRLITAPSPTLRDLQRLLLVLGIRDIPTHHASTAFRAGCSIAANARHHAAQPYLFKTDIVSFFPSIRVEGLANCLRSAFAGMSADAHAALMEVVALDGCLAQGAPTSPHLSNVFMRDFDQKMCELAKAVGARYSRYADDIAISANTDAPLAVLADTVRVEVAELGLKIHDRKTRRLGPRDRKIVTGLDVTTVDIRPTRQFRKKTQAMLRAYVKYGKPELAEPLKGRLAFWNGVAPHDPALRSSRESLFRAIEEQNAAPEEPQFRWQFARG